MSFQDFFWDAIIVNYNASIFLDPCLRAIGRIQPGPDRIIVVDNASTDDSVLELAGWPEVEVIESHVNRGYAGGANLGIRASSAPFAVILNPDVELASNFGTALQAVFSRDARLGAAGAKLLFPNDNVIQHAGGRVAWPGLTTSHLGERETDEGQHDESVEVDYVTGAAIALRRLAVESVGGFDELFHPAYWEDVDLCWRLRRAGWSVRYEPELAGSHHEGGGVRREDDYFAAWMRNRLRFAMKHMTSQQWWREFLPHEIERLRGDLSAIEDERWPVRSGGSAIELLARSGNVIDASFDSQLDGTRLIESVEAIRQLPALADPRPGSRTSEVGLVARLRRFLSRFSGRLWAEDFYWQQRQFNESVVRAFDAQDRLNRELTVEILMSLILVGRRRVARLPLDNPPKPRDKRERREG